ncbi:hypothetical protein BMS3Bbin07_00487 [bacterium BMS3Bbin07]|nr:hypothetical protein BMS3Bbin07_00487 [bacterium BMS3Bbin07]
MDRSSGEDSEPIACIQKRDMDRKASKDIAKVILCFFLLAITLICFAKKASAMEAVAEYGRGDFMRNGDAPWSQAFDR